MVACGSARDRREQDRRNDEFEIHEINSYHRRVQTVIVDSCEYLYGPWGNATVLTHKGNCKNHK